jgi:K+ transporter
LFAPIMLTYFVTLAVLGVANMQMPRILRRLNRQSRCSSSSPTVAGVPGLGSVDARGDRIGGALFDMGHSGEGRCASRGSRSACRAWCSTTSARAR